MSHPGVHNLLTPWGCTPNVLKCCESYQIHCQHRLKFRRNHTIVQPNFTENPVWTTIPVISSRFRYFISSQMFQQATARLSPPWSQWDPSSRRRRPSLGSSSAWIRMAATHQSLPRDWLRMFQVVFKLCTNVIYPKICYNMPVEMGWSSGFQLCPWKSENDKQLLALPCFTAI